MEEEIWKPIPGWEGSYAVSNMGRIKGLEGRESVSYNWHGRPVTKRHWKERIIKQQAYGKRDHYQVMLCGRTYKVHVLVAEAFLGPRPTPAMEPDHLNNNGLDNRVSNLEWVTRSENILRSYRRDGHPRITGHPRDSKGRFLAGALSER